MARPGIMLYFDIRQPLKVLPDADKGRLLDAILEYGEHGTVPEFDGMLALAWGFIQPKLDRDEESYENAKVQRQYAAFCKRRTSLNLPKIPFEEWLRMGPDERKRTSTGDNEPLRPVDFVNDRYPSTTASTSTSSKAKSSANTSVTATELGVGDLFDDIWIAYPELRRGSRQEAYIAYKNSVMTVADAELALRTLSKWKNSKQWGKSGGQYVPYLCNWLERGLWAAEPAEEEVPKGASGELGQAEIEAIERMMREG